jgi:protein tyrosine/serine phosphatase
VSDDIFTRPSGLIIRRVSGSLYRSAQPKVLEDWEFLRDMLGVTTVVKLNTEEEGSENGARALGLTVRGEFEIPMSDGGLVSDAEALFVRPSAELLEGALAVMAEGNCLLHCAHGQDRTGLLAALWRVRHDGWSTARAWEEALELGYHVEFVGLDRSWWDENAAGRAP